MDMIGTIINSGRYGTVRSVFNTKLNKNIAVKILPKKRNDLSAHKNNEMIMREIIAWKDLTGQHNIVKLYDIIDDENNIYFLSEQCNHNLFQKNIYKMSNIDKDYIIKNTLNGLYQCHSNNYYHGDIKPANILVDDNNIIKLCDFGNSLPSSQEYNGLFGNRGTPFYSSPDISSEYNQYGRNADMWSFGIIIYQYYHFNLHPFYKNDICNRLFINHENIEWNSEIDNNIKDFILKCLECNKEKRISSKDALTHPYIKNIL